VHMHCPCAANWRSDSCCNSVIKVWTPPHVRTCCCCCKPAPNPPAVLAPIIYNSMGLGDRVWKFTEVQCLIFIIMKTRH